jgi:hypothetical protein
MTRELHEGGGVRQLSEALYDDAKWLVELAEKLRVASSGAKGGTHWQLIQIARHARIAAIDLEKLGDHILDIVKSHRETVWRRGREGHDVHRELLVIDGIIMDVRKELGNGK